MVTMRSDSCSVSVVEQIDICGGKQQHAWDIADNVFPVIEVFDEFVEYPVGYVKYAYSGTCAEARTHQSGWAARNANNHNQAILKKSCLGVLLCTHQCNIANGLDIVRVRPSICDKARKKQINQPCPNDGCNGRLYLKPCRGHSGYPVTHFWREVLAADGRSTIFFQAKGEHDHPRPERKSASQRRSSNKIVNENWTPVSYAKSVRRIKRLSNKSKRLASSNSNDVITSQQQCAFGSMVDVQSAQTSQCYQTVHRQASSWASDFYHQMRPTVIREPQTHTLHTWNNTDYPSPYQAANRTSYSNASQLQQPTSPWCDTNRSQMTNFNTVSNAPTLPSFHKTLYQQQTSCPYAKTGSQWLSHMPATCDANDDIISGGIYRWNSPGWNQAISNSLMKSGNVMKQHDFQFEPSTVLTPSGYSTFSNHF